MRSRSLTSAAALVMLLALFACSKSSDNTASNPSANPPATGSSEQPAASEPAPPPPAVIPKGTTLTVRLGEALGSKISQPGQGFSATLARPVKVEGKELIPAGAKVSGTVVDAKPLGHFKGGALLQLKLASVDINGNDQPVHTTSITQTKKGKGKRSAVAVGGGAGLGALVGGLLGGGKGAAVGAVAGAGAGTAGAAYTGNDEIVLPAESALSFRLTQAIQIQ